MATVDLQQVKQKFGIIGNSEELNRAIDIAIQVAPTDLSVLITGESGVGKESFPKILHQFSVRKHNNYIAVNCGAIPEGTIDSELFGHEKGAFTGAIGERKGYFGEVNGGTIFLDEVGELPLSTQARLLRVLESGEYIKVGSSRVEKTNVRIVAATNVNLPKAIAEGRFREDLYYRLNTVPIMIPPLRDRKEDIVLLFRKFAYECAEKYRMPAIKLSEEAKQILVAYNWPGNIRELKNVTERISVIEQHRDITKEIMSKYIRVQQESRGLTLVGQPQSSTYENEREILYKILYDLRKDVTELKKLVHDITEERNKGGEVVKERRYLNSNIDLLQPDMPRTTIIEATDDDDAQYQETEEYVEENLAIDNREGELIRKALAKHKGNRKKAALDLNISERTLYRKIKEYELE